MHVLAIDIELFNVVEITVLLGLRGMSNETFNMQNYNTWRANWLWIVLGNINMLEFTRAVEASSLNKTVCRH